MKKDHVLGAASLVCLLACLVPTPAKAERGVVARANPQGDLVLAKPEHWLLRWQGALAGVRIPKPESLLGGGPLPRLRQTTVRDLMRHAPQRDVWPAEVQQLDPEAPVAGWLCSSSAIWMILAPKNEPLEQLRTARMGANELTRMVASSHGNLRWHSGNTSIAACTFNNEGQLLVVLQNQANIDDPLVMAPRLALPFDARWQPVDLHEPQPSRQGHVLFVEQAFSHCSGNNDSPCSWRLVSKAMPSSGSLNNPRHPDAWQLHHVSFDLARQTTHQWHGFPQEPQSEASRLRFVARQDQILAWHGDHLSLTTIPFPIPAVVTAQRLPVNPCNDEQLCGLSLAEDGTWAASGYWGTFAGRNNTFRRLSVPHVAGPQDAVHLAHSGAPGDVLLAGPEETTIEPVPFDFPAQGDLRILSEGPSAVWLRPGVQPKISEEVVMVVTGGTDGTGTSQSPVSVALTTDSFDPSRHLAKEDPWLLALHQPDDPKAKHFGPVGHVGTLDTQDGLWWHQATQAPQVDDLLQTQGVVPMTVVLAVLDSGADLQHPDFFPFSKEGMSHGSTDLGPEEFGYDFVDDDAWPQDAFGHGTHVAGLAKPAFSAFDSIRLLIVRVLDASGKSNSIAIGRGFLYAARKGAEVINASWGGGPKTQFMADAIATAQHQGALVITSAGNDNQNIDRDPPVPGHVPDVVSIGSLTPKEARARSSNHGRSAVLVFSPGDTIRSLALGGGTKIMSGTSMAAPLFAAQVAAALGTARSLGHEQAKNLGWRPWLIEGFCRASSEWSEQRRKQDPMLRWSRCGTMRPLNVFEGLFATPDW
jgi:hypothetical protein